MKKKPKIFSIEEPIFRTCINVYLGCTYEFMYKHIEKINPKMVEHFTKPADQVSIFGLYKDFQLQEATYRVLYFKTENLPIIAHEIFHAVYHILKWRDITLESSSEELFAYYTEFLFEKILDHITLTK